MIPKFQDLTLIKIFSHPLVIHIHTITNTSLITKTTNQPVSTKHPFYSVFSVQYCVSTCNDAFRWHPFVSVFYILKVKKKKLEHFSFGVTLLLICIDSNLNSIFKFDTNFPVKIIKLLLYIYRFVVFHTGLNFFFLFKKKVLKILFDDTILDYFKQIFVVNRPICVSFICIVLNGIHASDIK